MQQAGAAIFSGGTTPDPTALPGGSELMHLTQGLEWWALAIAPVGVLVGAASWAIGSHSQNFNQAVSGRRAVLVSGLAALIVGAAPSLIQWFFQAGSSVH